MNELDKWAAEVCGITLIDDLSEVECKFSDVNGKTYWMRNMWTLSDARCRDVFVDKYKISIIYNQKMKGWVAEESKRYNFTYAPEKRDGYRRADDSDEQVFEGGEYALGKSIEEAFLLCAKQIMEQTSE